jgi:hypothetical protein
MMRSWTPWSGRGERERREEPSRWPRAFPMQPTQNSTPIDHQCSGARVPPRAASGLCRNLPWGHVHRPRRRPVAERPWLVTPAPVRARAWQTRNVDGAHGERGAGERAVNLAGTCHPRPPIHSLGALLLSPHQEPPDAAFPTCCGPGDVDPFRLFRKGTRYFFSRGLPSLHASHTGARQGETARRCRNTASLPLHPTIPHVPGLVRNTLLGVHRRRPWSQSSQYQSPRYDVSQLL